MEDARPLKRRRGARSCLACRKAKQRCDLPDAAAIRPSEEPQPLSMCCHRCKMLKQACIVVDPVKDSQQSAQQQSKTSSSSSTSRDATAASGQKQQALHTQHSLQEEANGTTQQRQEQKGRQTSSQSRMHPKLATDESDPLRRSMILSGSPNSSSHDLQIFDPFAVSAPSDASSSPSVSNSSAPSPAFLHQKLNKRFSSSTLSPTSMERPTDGTRRINSNTRSVAGGFELPEWASHVSLLFQPLRLLSELCWRLPTFQAANDPSNVSKRSKQTTGQDQQTASGPHSPVSDLLSDESIPWRMLETKLYQMRHFLPAMASLEELRQRRSSDFLLIVLLFVTLDNGRLRQKAEKAAAEMAMAALLQGASDPEGITALLVLGLYSPTLLLSNSPSQANLGQSSFSMSGPPLDGLGFFNSAASAANALDIGLAAASLPRSSPTTSSASLDKVLNEDTSHLTSILRETSLWITLGVHAASFVLAGDIKRKPFIECDENMVKSVEAYCCQEEVKKLAPSLRQCLARLLIDIFRLRAWTGALARCKGSRRQIENIDQCSTEVVQQRVSDHHDWAQGLRQLEMRILRDRLYYLGFNDDKTMEWLDVEVAQIYYLSMAQTQSALMLSTAYLMAQASSSREYLQLIMQDKTIMPRLVISGQAHGKSARKFAALLCSFGDRREAMKLWSPPPILLSACAVMVAKTMAEELASRFNAGHVPVKDLTDSLMEVAVVMTRDLAKVLSSYSSSTEPADSSNVCDVFAASAVVTRRTADAVDEWACTAKGLRFAHVVPPHMAEPEGTGTTTSATTSMGAPGPGGGGGGGGKGGGNGFVGPAQSMGDGPTATVFSAVNTEQQHQHQQQQRPLPHYPLHQPYHGRDGLPIDGSSSSSSSSNNSNRQTYMAPPTYFAPSPSSAIMLSGMSSTGNFNPTSAAFGTEDDLDRLLREILSTPIDEYLMPEAFR